VCLIAIILVSSAESDKPAKAGQASGLRGWLAGTGFHGRAVAYGLGAGTSFGLFFLFIRNAGQSGPIWPVAAARLAGLAVILIAAAATRTRPVLARASGRLLLATAGSGVLDASANICYVIATRHGLFGLAVVLTSLYPGITVLLARFTLGERMRLTQRAGLLLAGVGVVLVTI
jgi:drug/metabolite transporter (DMT)-like permease